jgi:hypothetical protein
VAVAVEHHRYREDMHMTTFHELHARGRLLVLPNAWDAASARLVEDAGAEAIATTSSGVAWAQGYPDGNAMPPAVVVAAVAAIARVIRVPLTADVEAGYSAEPASSTPARWGSTWRTVRIRRTSSARRSKPRNGRRTAPESISS